MKCQKRSGAVILSCFLLWCGGFWIAGYFSSGHAAEDTPQAALIRFFDVYPSVRGSGVSWGKEPDRLATVLSRALHDLLTKASKAEGDVGRLRPDEPWGVEGDLWTSLFEGADRSHIGSCKITGKQALCEVSLTNDEAPATTWTDVFVLTRTGGNWAVDDVRWGGDWEFMHKGTLRDLLSYEIKRAAEIASGVHLIDGAAKAHHK
ncbi:hypothetical protein [Magnetospirillum molischianum]|uniref:DUF3828 domain-containing protein n=1 Tax=Magnetospirillum molischianum DSM 120 TaxID=1150626 RepID=H8FXT6_MAGML|nr:hypothetical protein [Magnetospirillum molischianum]CCG43174.1 conserved exported hypothetical protein [Magnetospirillum molischianum DSM 120]